MSRHLPRVGHWYQDCVSRQIFEVVALDREEGTIQVQYLDGAITDFDQEGWADLELRLAAEPEDWRVAFELDEDATIDDDSVLHPLQWASPLSRIEPDTVLGIDEFGT
jgi:hypothetical protein